jgi:hypothetical protein
MGDKISQIPGHRFRCTDGIRLQHTENAGPGYRGEKVRDIDGVDVFFPHMVPSMRNDTLPAFKPMGTLMPGKKVGKDQ